MTRFRVAPGTWLFAAVLICLASAMICSRIVTRPPWLGVTLVPATDSSKRLVVVAVHPDGPAAKAQVRPGDTLVSIVANGQRVELAGSDIIEEPDLFDTYPEMDGFFAKQSSLFNILSGPTVTMELHSAGGARAAQVTPAPERLVGSLPLVFWMQLFFGAAGCVIGVWVWSLRPKDWGARMYAITGAMFLLFSNAAAPYSVRELAISGGLFRLLSGLNHTGATLFGAALCGLFLSYPKMLVKPRVLVALLIAGAVWVFTDVARIAPDQDWGARMPVMLTMLGAIIIAFVQWFKTKGDPEARTALRWFGLWALVGCGLFVSLVVVTSFSGLLPPIAQGYSFGFFLLMYAGFAFGLRRYRLFDLDEWAWKILFWVVAAASLIGFDLFLINVARMEYARSLGLTLLLALAYLPLRHWVWDRTFRRDRVPEHELFDEVLRVSFARSDEERARRWRNLLVRLFDPLHITEDAARDVRDVTLDDPGLVLSVPAVASSGMLKLSHPWSGRRLFAPRHVRLAENIVRLMRTADESRQAFQQGVLLERSRIARDLHDDVSSPLLAGLSHADDEQVRRDIRDALTQMRSIVSNTGGAPSALADCMADIRYEAVQRLQHRSIAVEWPLHELGDTIFDADRRKALMSWHHEVVTNILKHAHATRVVVDARVEHDTLTSRVTDDGVGFDPATIATGQGLPNLRARATALGGAITIKRASATGRGTIIELVIPVTAHV